MAKVHFVENAQVVGVHTERDGATPIVPLSGLVFVRLHAPTTDELDLPWKGSALALHPELAKSLAQGLLQAIRELEDH